MTTKSRSFSHYVWLAFGVITAVMTVLALHQIFFVAPVEVQMGIVQKIFYFHVPSAYGMYLGFGASAIGSAVYLAKRDPKWDAVGVAGAEVGMLFCIMVLATGPLWARKAWGLWWTWDPRLTTTLLAGLIFASYLGLRGSGNVGEIEKRFASGLALLGIPTGILIHYSVQKWRGQHPTVITSKGGGLHPDMKPALIMCFVLFTFFAIWLIWTRIRVERNAQRVHALTLSATRQDKLKEV